MSTILNTNGENLVLPEIDSRVQGNFVVITAEWNKDITYSLRDGAVATLKACGVGDDKIKCVSVPGTVELVNGAGFYCRREGTSAVIVIGVVIRGDTPHFDYVCQIAAEGVALLNSRGEVPVIFGVLTVDTPQQAIERAGGRLGNKGSEAASAAVAMANMHAEAEKSPANNI